MKPLVEEYPKVLFLKGETKAFAQFFEAEGMWKAFDEGGEVLYDNGDWLNVLAWLENQGYVCQAELAGRDGRIFDGEWQRHFPEEEGDWVWIWQWSCGCCLLYNGIAWVQTKDMMPESPDVYYYKTKAGIEMAVSFGKQQPQYVDGKPDIHWWMKIELPPHFEEVERELRLKKE